MRVANITTAVAIVLWLCLAMLGRDGLRPFLIDNFADWPPMAAIDFRIVFPMSVALALLTLAWFFNALKRWPLALGLSAVACLALILPYLALSGGGV